MVTAITVINRMIKRHEKKGYRGRNEIDHLEITLINTSKFFMSVAAVIAEIENDDEIDVKACMEKHLSEFGPVDIRQLTKKERTYSCRSIVFIHEKK